MDYKRRFKGFLGNREGGVAPMLALAALPLIGSVGAAVDYSRVASARTAMQSVLDATALDLSKNASTITAEDLAQKANDFFNAQFVRPEAYNVKLTPVLSQPEQGSFKLTITGSGTVDLVFAKLLGQSKIDFSASAEARWGMKKLNLALVLDNTGSMSTSGKMTNLKAASHKLLDVLEKAAKTPGDIKIAIVPFATDVNAGTANANASWIDWTDWEAINGECSQSSKKDKASCLAAGKIWTPDPRSTWNGCVYDRDQNNDVANTASVAGAPATLFRAHQADACPTSMIPLSTSWPALHSKIDAMTPTGKTNVTIGLAWGFQVLSPNAPFNAPAPAPDLDKVIIILTDGENTENRWTENTSSIDSRTQKVCDNIKAANIKLYTVRVINGNAALLQGCATKPSMYYDVQQADQLVTVFNSIAQNLANLRISK
jgi:Flp pilus assembly protein TadG